MNTATVSSTISPPLNVGVYGTTRAGKTRFLYELLSGWQRDLRIVESSEQANQFLAEIGPDIRAYKHSRGTVKTLEGIKVVVQRGGDQQPWRLTFRDLRGEFLAHEVDDLGRAARSTPRQASIPHQVRECNSFVFFFDPTSEDAPEQIEAHYARELRRAGRFIDYVLAERQNRYLPILFVLTRLDRWEADPDLRARITDWITRVNQLLRTSYRRALDGHFPSRLVDPLATTLCISSLRSHETEQVVERLGDLVQECEEFHQRDRRRLRGVLASLALTLGLFALVTAGVFWWIGDTATGKPTSTRPPRTDVRLWSSDEVRAHLAEVERLLSAHPPGKTLPSLAEARSLNEAFRWLPVKLEATRTDTAFPTKLRTEMTATLERLVGVVQAKLEPVSGEPLQTRWELVQAYLEDVPDVAGLPALEQLRGDAWALGRQQFVQQLAGILERREAVESPPLETIIEALSALRTEEQELKRVRIGGLKAQHDLIDEVQTAATFLEVYKNSRRYRANFRLVSAHVLGANVSDIDRGVQWTTPNPAKQERVIHLKPKRVDASEVTFSTNQPSYPFEIGLGGPVTLHLLIWSQASNGYEPLMKWDLAAKPWAGPLGVLGFPLLEIGRTTVQKKLEWQGYELKFEWVDLPRAPRLLEQAAVQADRPAGGIGR